MKDITPAPLRTEPVFWAEMAPCDHVVQIYDADDAFLDSLEAFVVAGLRAQDAVVLIATPQHLSKLEARLWTHHFDLISESRSRDQFITLDAEDTLSKFMVHNWPDEQRFKDMIAGVLARALSRSPRVRAFGEMVALLWSRGLSGATVRLEHLWHQICQRENFPLFCAYPKSGFTQNSESSMREICNAHSKSLCC